MIEAVRLGEQCNTSFPNQPIPQPQPVEQGWGGCQGRPQPGLPQALLQAPAWTGLHQSGAGRSGGPGWEGAPCLLVEGLSAEGNSICLIQWRRGT